jgi:hypothetical protein
MLKHGADCSSVTRAKRLCVCVEFKTTRAYSWCLFLLIVVSWRIRLQLQTVYWQEQLMRWRRHYNLLAPDRQRRKIAWKVTSLEVKRLGWGDCERPERDTVPVLLQYTYSPLWTVDDTLCPPFCNLLDFVLRKYKLREMWLIKCGRFTDFWIGYLFIHW